MKNYLYFLFANQGGNISFVMLVLHIIVVLGVNLILCIIFGLFLFHILKRNAHIIQTANKQNYNIYIFDIYTLVLKISI